MEIIIERAVSGDLPALAEINRLAYTPETAAQIAFKNWPDEKNMYGFFVDRVRERFESANTQVYKAVRVGSEEILGFICWTLEGGDETKSTEPVAAPAPNEPVPTPTAAVASKLPAGLNIEFVMASGKQIEGLRTLMTGTKHYYVSTFVVPPVYQGKGIGSQLLRYCLHQADKEKLETWLISFPGSHPLYLKFGFTDVEHCDIDLNEHDGKKYRGFGIYRNYAMVRKAQGE